MKVRERIYAEPYDPARDYPGIHRHFVGSGLSYDIHCDIRSAMSKDTRLGVFVAQDERGHITDARIVSDQNVVVKRCGKIEVMTKEEFEEWYEVISD